MPDLERPTDAELVTAVNAGDLDGFVGIYDRYVDRIYSYCLNMLHDPDQAAEATHDAFLGLASRIEELDSPSTLESWLFRTARNEIKSDQRSPLRQPSGELAQTLIDHPDVALNPDHVRLLTEVWEAVEDLGERDLEILTLHYAEGLVGDDLARAMGVDVSRLDDLVSRSRSRVDRALGSLLIARMGSDDCQELPGVLAAWIGDFSADVRSRVAKHIGGCETCKTRRADLMTPGRVLTRIMIVPAPSSLRSGVLLGAAAVVHPPEPESEVPASAAPVPEPVPAAPAPRPPPPSREVVAARAPSARDRGLDEKSMLVMFVAVTAIVGLIGLAVSAQFEPLDPQSVVSTQPAATSSTTTTAAPAPTSTAANSDVTGAGQTTVPAGPGEIEISSEAINFGDEATTEQFEVSNAGGQPVAFTAETSVDWLVLSAGGHELGAGESVTYDVMLDREQAPEGEVSETITIAWGDGSAEIGVTGSTVGNPILHNPQASPSTVEVDGGDDCDNTQTTVSVRVRDGSPLESVVVQWSPDGGGTTDTPMADVGGDIFEAQIGPFTSAHTASVRMVARDELGNAGGTTITVEVTACG